MNMNDKTREQIKWLRKGVAGGHAITIADNLERLNAIETAARDYVFMLAGGGRGNDCQIAADKLMKALAV